MKDYYAQLGVAPDATVDTIKSAYRKKASQFHPDRNPDPFATHKFREAQEAYEVLADEQQRKAYDDTRQRSLIDTPLPVATKIWENIIENAFRK
jgi:DnaJ-class molecular chaperone